VRLAITSLRAALAPDAPFWAAHAYHAPATGYFSFVHALRADSSLRAFLHRLLLENKTKLRQVEEELSLLQRDIKMTSAPKKQAMEMMRKKIEARPRVSVLSVPADAHRAARSRRTPRDTRADAWARRPLVA
jgi:hypothetical protein